jgi:hypothetical protein
MSKGKEKSKFTKSLGKKDNRSRDTLMAVRHNFLRTYREKKD